MWFIPPYIALYWLAPMLNTFVEKAEYKTIVQVLISFIILDVSIGWLKDYLNFKMGYTILNFMLIYLTARFFKVHKPVLISKHRRIYLFIYFAICSILVSLNYLAYSVNPEYIKHTGSLFFYNSPFVLISSISLGVYFTKLKIKSKFVNKVAASCFAVYLFHMNPLVKPFFRDVCNCFFDTYDIIIHSFIMFFFVLTVFIVAILIDQIRIFISNCINKIHFSTVFNA